MGVASFFFDTYALFELMQKNPNYEKYLKGIELATTKLNLMELHYGVGRKAGWETADDVYSDYAAVTIPIMDEDIKQANRFRYLHKTKKLSYTDCIGYTIAKRMNLKFLTGDIQFKDIDNVEFVK